MTIPQILNGVPNEIVFVALTYGAIVALARWGVKLPGVVYRQDDPNTPEDESKLPAGPVDPVSVIRATLAQFLDTLFKAAPKDQHQVVVQALKEATEDLKAQAEPGSKK